MRQKSSAAQKRCTPKILTTRYSLFAVILAEVGGYRDEAC